MDPTIFYYVVVFAYAKSSFLMAQLIKSTVLNTDLGLFVREFYLLKSGSEWSDKNVSITFFKALVLMDVAWSLSRTSQMVKFNFADVNAE